MTKEPIKCSECTAVYQFEGGNTYVCPKCAHEYTPETESKEKQDKN